MRINIDLKLNPIVDVAGILQNTQNISNIPNDNNILTIDDDNSSCTSSENNSNVKEPIQKQQRKRKIEPEEEYDLEDDFIDDSDIIYNHIFIETDAPPVGQDWNYGFFAWRGDVQTFLDENYSQESSRKSRKDRLKSKNTTNSTSSTPQRKKSIKKSPEKQPNSSSKTSKTISNSISSTSISTPPPGPSNSSIENVKNEIISVKNEVQTSSANILVPLHPRVQQLIEILDLEAKKEKWENKKNFPPHLRVLIHDAARVALETNTFKSEHFVPYLTRMMPYNTYTMKKLLGRMIIPEQCTMLKKEVDIACELMKTKINEMVNVQKKELMQIDSPNPAKDGKYKFKWDEEIRALLWNILCIEWEMAKLDNDYQLFNKQQAQFNEASVRKAVYNKLVSFWPTGWIDSAAISAQYSNQKQRVEKGLKDKTAGGITIRADPFSKTVRNKTPLKKEKTADEKSLEAPKIAEVVDLT